MDSSTEIAHTPDTSTLDLSLLNQIKPQEQRDRTIERLKFLVKEYRLAEPGRFQSIDITSNSGRDTNRPGIKPLVVVNVPTSIFEEIVNEELVSSVLIPPDASQRAYSKVWTSPEVLGEGISLSTIATTGGEGFYAQRIGHSIERAKGKSNPANLRLAGQKEVLEVTLQPYQPSKSHTELKHAEVSPHPRHATPLPEGLKG